jgi:putative membrane protein
VSNLLRWLLSRFEKPTLGALLGLLLGAVVGLWPFQAPVAPQVGDLVRGVTVSIETLAGIDAKDWPLAHFQPTAAQTAAALALIGLGIATTALIARIGGGADGFDSAT